MTTTFFLSLFQITGDLTCIILTLSLLKKSHGKQSTFFFLNFLAFTAALIGDIYYNYLFRLHSTDIIKSVESYMILPILIFQILQTKNWFSTIYKKSDSIFSINNIPYAMFSLFVASILTIYFHSSINLSQFTITYQTISMILDVIIWLLGIICLARTNSLSIIFLSFGLLMIISADLTSRWLFMFEPGLAASTIWVHLIWTSGIWFMAIGFGLCHKKLNFNFSRNDSIQARCNAYTSTTAIIAFIIGYVFLNLFETTSVKSIMDTFWYLPISLMFLMVTSVVIGSWLSLSIRSPIDQLNKKISQFRENNIIEKNAEVITKIHEIEELNKFVNSSFNLISDKLDVEIQISSQVAHDIRSPLLSLEIVNKRIPESVNESLRHTFRDAIKDIRDITNNLDQKARLDDSNEFTLGQIATLIQNVVNDREIAFSDYEKVKINWKASPTSFAIFSKYTRSIMKRILTIVLNNSLDAIKATNNMGEINISCKAVNKSLLILISDNGVGIDAEAILKVFDRGFTSKNNGSGIGLYYAKNNIEKWGGKISLKSEPDKGCTTIIELPLENTPSWFTSKLIIPKNATIFCLDDSISIANSWKQRFSQLVAQYEFIHCKGRTELIKSLPSTPQRSALFLIDFEIMHKNYNGIDVINSLIKLGISTSQIYMVTSHSNDRIIKNFCTSNDIRIIPKHFVEQITIKFI